MSVTASTVSRRMSALTGFRSVHRDQEGMHVSQGFGCVYISATQDSHRLARESSADVEDAMRAIGYAVERTDEFRIIVRLPEDAE